MSPDRSGPLCLLPVKTSVTKVSSAPGAPVATSFLECTVGWFVPEPSVPSLWDPWSLFWAPLHILSRGIVFAPIRATAHAQPSPPS